MKIIITIVLATLLLTVKSHAQSGKTGHKEQEKSTGNPATKSTTQHNSEHKFWDSAIKCDTIITMDAFGRKRIQIFEKNGNRIQITTTISRDSSSGSNVISVQQTRDGNNVEVTQSGPGNSVSISQHSNRKED